MRGRSHEVRGAPNQDHISWLEFGDLPPPYSDRFGILAVADGHGSRRFYRSDVGSAVAARVAVSVAFERLKMARAIERTDRGILGLLVKELPQLITERWTADVLAHRAAHPVTPTENEGSRAREAKSSPESTESADSSPRALAHPYGSTLLLAIALPSCVLCLQLGDGDILVVDSAGTSERTFAEGLEFLGDVTASLCDPNAASEIRTRIYDVTANGPELVVLSTDGYSKSCVTDEGFLEIGGRLLGFLREHGLETVVRWIPRWLNEVNEEGSADDTTMGFLYRSRPPVFATDEVPEAAATSPPSASPAPAGPEESSPPPLPLPVRPAESIPSGDRPDGRGTVS